MKVPNNSIQTAGIEFIEFTALDPIPIEQAIQKLGFTCVADHRHKNVRLYRQNEINFVLNAEPGSLAISQAHQHGPTTNAVAFRVHDILDSMRRAKELHLQIVESTAGPMELNIPAIQNNEGLLIYLVDAENTPLHLRHRLSLRSDVNPTPTGPLTRIDHLTRNVNVGQLEEDAEFFKRNFGFKETQRFDINGEKTGLKSIALSSPGGLIKLPINEPKDPQSQIAEFIQEHHGSGFQHIALETANIYDAVRLCRMYGIEFQTTPNAYYHSAAKKGLVDFKTIERLQRHQCFSMAPLLKDYFFRYSPKT